MQPQLEKHLSAQDRIECRASWVYATLLIGSGLAFVATFSISLLNPPRQP